MALPYVDKEYDHPMVAAAVDDLILREMRIGTYPKLAEYIKHLPYPTLKKCIDTSGHIVGSSSSSRIDRSRYSVNAPDKSQENDAIAWKDAVNNAKSQLQHQYNRLNNLELMVSSGSTVWLETNELIQGNIDLVNNTTLGIKRKIDSINHARRVGQVRCQEEVNKYIYQRDQAVLQGWQLTAILSHYNDDIIEEDSREGEQMS